MSHAGSVVNGVALGLHAMVNNRRSGDGVIGLIADVLQVLMGFYREEGVGE